MSIRIIIATAIWAVSGFAEAQSSGTAFVVAPGLLITNHHVIEGCSSIDVVAAEGRRPATVVDSVRQIDLALLRVYGLRVGVATLRTQSKVRLGEASTVFGFPLAGSLSSGGNFTTGVVSSLRGLRDAAGEIQITAPVQPGNSGGPVLDRSGLVIGVVQSKLDALLAIKATGDIPQNVNFAVSLEVLADFLKKNKVDFSSAPEKAAVDNSAIAELAQTFTFQVSCTQYPSVASTPPKDSQIQTPPKREIPTQRPSFDCSLARTIVEKLICSDEQLSALDRRMADLYRDRIRRALDPIAARSEQIQWLTQFRNLCTTKQCLVEHYQRRIAELSTADNSADQNHQVRGGSYGSQVRACVQPRVVFRTPPRTSSFNPTATYRIQLTAAGTITDLRLTRSSGDPQFDIAVYDGILGCTVFPRPPSGAYPSYIDINYSMYD
jgi:TonB family protein